MAVVSMDINRSFHAAEVPALHEESGRASGEAYDTGVDALPLRASGIRSSRPPNQPGANDKKRNQPGELLSELAQFLLPPKEGTAYSTHGIHPYSAKFIPQIAGRIIDECSNERHLILDPFCGSGTTLLEARSKGRDSIGVDVNPIGVLISKAKTTPLDEADWDEVENCLSTIDEKFQKRDYSRAWFPKIPSMGHWFQPQIAKDLGLIAGEIRRLKRRRAKDLLEVALSSIIVRVSNQKSETEFVAIEKRPAEGIVRASFFRKAKEISARVHSLSLIPAVQRSKTTVILGDTRHLRKCLRNRRKADLVVTSPPYLNSYDYYLYHKFRMFWLGFDRFVTPAIKVQSKELGSRYQYSSQRESLSTFRDEMCQCLGEIARATKPSKLLFLLVGDSVLRGSLIMMNEFYKSIAKETGWEFVAETSYSLRDITRSFKGQKPLRNTSFVKKQHILIFRNRFSSRRKEAGAPTMAGAVQLVDQIPSSVETGAHLVITSNNVTGYTHGMIRYPSKFIPQVPRWAIANFSEPGDVVLDPFVGSGTTMVEARLQARNSIGLDMNPFAVLASNVKSDPLDGAALENSLVRISKKVEIQDATRANIPDFPLKEFWFDPSVLRRISRILAAINEIEDRWIRDFFKLTLGSIVKACSYWDEDQIKVERDQRKLLMGVPDPISLFTARASSNIASMREYAKVASPSCYSVASVADSRMFPHQLSHNGKRVELNSVNLIVTSPPYINAINYPMFDRYELILLGLINPEDYIAHQRGYLGSERVYAKEYRETHEFELGGNRFQDLNEAIAKVYNREPKRSFLTWSYFKGMASSLAEMHRVIKPGGSLVLVSGSNSIKGVHIPTYDVLRRCAEELGFVQSSAFSYQIRNHRFKIIRHETGRQIIQDHIIVMRKA